MAIYEVELNGEVYEVEGDSPAAVENFVAEMGKVNAQESDDDGLWIASDEAAGYGKTAANLVSGVFAEPVAGLAGMFGTAYGGGDVDKGVGIMEKVRNALTAYSDDEQVQANLQGIGESGVGQALQKFDSATTGAADWAFEKTGSPMVAAAVKAAPDALMEMIPGGALAVPVNSAVKNVGRASRSAGRAAGRLGEASEIIAGAPRSAGAAETAAEAARRADLERRIYEAEQAGLTGELGLTEGQATRDLPTQALESQTSKSDGGQAIIERYAAQNEQLLNSMDDVRYEVGRSDDGELIERSRHQVGRSVKEVFEAGKAKANAEVDAAYTKARATDEISAPAKTGPLDDLLGDAGFAKFKLYPGSKAGFSGIEELLVQGNYADLVDGKLVMKDATIGSMEDLRSSLDGFIDPAQPQSQRMVKQFKDALDESLDLSDGGELFKEARAKRRQYSVEFDENEFVANLLKKKGSTSAAKIADEDVTSSVYKLPREELIRVRDQLKGMGAEGAAGWRALRAGIMADLIETSENMANRATGDTPGLKVERLASKIGDLSSDGKLVELFGEEAAAKLEFIVRSARTVNQPVRGAVNHSNTASHTIGKIGSMLKSVANSTGAIPVAGSAVKAAIDPVVDHLGKRANAKTAERLLAPQGGMLQRAAN